jgi:TRIAD3 protein (E3 ubiquitin-protein ligase RNF216)
MTAALVQKCNKCTKPFVKLSGCNKMTCNCGNLQCYVCGENIRDYRHFEKGKCPLHEQNDTRLDTKIMNAQEVAMKQVMEQEEGLKEEDLRVEIKRPEAPVAAMGQQAPVNPFLDLADFAPGGRFDPAAQVYPLQFLNQLNARHIGVQQFPEVT